MQYVAWLIEEAWDHRRRRHRRSVLAAVVVAAVGVFVLVMIADGSGSTVGSVAPRPPQAGVVAPSRVLSKVPYLGVNCPIANSIACDRVGLAVWLKRPAQSVSATIAGAPLALNWRGERPGTSAPRREFDGYLQPAGIVSRLHVRPEVGDETLTAHGRTRVIVSRRMWFGDGQVRSPLIRLTIYYPKGQTIVTQLRVALAAGWG